MIPTPKPRIGRKKEERVSASTSGGMLLVLESRYCYDVRSSIFLLKGVYVRSYFNVMAGLNVHAMGFIVEIYGILETRDVFMMSSGTG